MEANMGFACSKTTGSVKNGADAATAGRRLKSPVSSHLLGSTAPSQVERMHHRKENTERSRAHAL
jgi:hypothetical protein